jgi:AraC-like DNA-binding protein
VDHYTCALFPSEKFFELTLYQFGQERCKPMHLFGPAIRNHFLFHFILQGKGRLMSVDDQGVTKDYYLEGPQGFLLWPGQKNTYIADEDDPWQYAWVEFDGLKARDLVLQAGLEFNRPVYTAQYPEARLCMREELLYIITHAGHSPLELMGHFYLFMDALVASSRFHTQAQGDGLRNFYIREAVAFIEQHYQEEMSVDDIARYCHLNRSYLSRIFRSVLQSSPQDFIISYRLKKACELMGVTERPISEICKLVGYPNPINFSRAFKREVGKPPQQWRIEHREKKPIIGT